MFPFIIIVITFKLFIVNIFYSNFCFILFSSITIVMILIDVIGLNTVTGLLMINGANINKLKEAIVSRKIELNETTL